TLSDYAGSVVLIEYFSLSCAPCLRISEFLENLYQNNKDKGFIIFSVDVDGINDDLDKVKDYAERYGWTFPAFWDQLGLLPDLYGYEELPTTIIVGKDQKIAKATSRFHEQVEYQTWIDEAINVGQTAPRIIVSTNQIQYTMNQDRMQVYLEIINPGSLIAVDVAFALNHRPSDDINLKTWYAPEWSENFGSFRMTLEPGLVTSKVLAVDIPVPCFIPNRPPIFEPGDYIWAAVLFHAGSLNPLSNMSTAAVQVVEPKPLDPVVTVSTNQIIYKLNRDRMTVFLEVENPGSLIAVDLVFALYHAKPGSLDPGRIWFYPEWNEEFYSFRMILDPGLIVTKTRIIDIPLPCNELGSPPITEVGDYTWGAAFLKPGSLDPISGVSTATVQVVEPPSQEPVVIVSTDQLMYKLNSDRMKVFLEVENPGSMITVDLVFALYHAKSGSLDPGRIWFYPDWGEDFQSFRMILDPGLIVTKTRIIDIPLPCTDLGSPPITEAGDYTWAAAFLKPDSIDLVSGVSTATVKVIDELTPSLLQEPTEDPFIIVTTDAREYTMSEDTMGVYLEAGNPGPDKYVNIIFALYHVPPGSLEGSLWFYPDWTKSYKEILLTIPAQFTLAKTKVFDVPLPSLERNAPPIPEAGEYIWAVAFTEPGTTDFVGPISTASVLVKDSAIPTN
ncbi:TlpA family protein disulfide reductase, partial [bacterium]|nr:TlpA family protein disulfide reductase [bacterium]